MLLAIRSSDKDYRYRGKNRGSRDKIPRRVRERNGITSPPGKGWRKKRFGERFSPLPFGSNGNLTPQENRRLAAQRLVLVFASTILPALDPIGRFFLFFFFFF